MSDIGRNLQEIQDRIGAACAKVGRRPQSVELVAVSKTFPATLVEEAVVAGQLLFGESRLQEAEPKIAVLPGKLRWHFIGRVQTNKVRKILPLFDSIHAIDSLRLAHYTAGAAKDLGLFPKVFLQVNVGGEASKGGFELDQLEREIDELLAVERLEIQGFMTIPPPGVDGEASRQWFIQLRELRDAMERRTGVRLPSLSMGMSGDYEVAIEEGATHVRVGSAIFGGRAYRVAGELG